MGNFVVLFFIFIIVVEGIFSRVKIFDLFVEGVRDGLKTVLNLFPVLLGLLLGISLLRASGFINILTSVFGPVFIFIGIPKEVVALAFLKPFSGSASIAIAADLMKEYDVNSLVSFITAIIMGSTETIVYAMCVYTGNVKKKVSYKVIVLAIVGNVLAIVLASFFGRVFYKIP